MKMNSDTIMKYFELLNNLNIVTIPMDPDFNGSSDDSSPIKTTKAKYIKIILIVNH